MRRVLVAGLLVLPFVVLGPSSATNAAEEPEAPARLQIVCLEAEEPDMSGDSPSGKLYFREFLRQAVLIAARDEARLGTRDMVLREDFPEEAPRYSIVTSRTKSKYCRLRISPSGDRSKVLYEKELVVPHTEGGIDYLGLLVAAEELSRGELKEFWTSQGKEVDTNRAIDQEALPGELLQSLTEMNCLSQMVAIRQLHALHKQQGESTESLAALARGYANLGQFLQLHWNSSHKALKARALLYAQRLVAKHPNSADGLFHRAYAEALTGLHRQALADLEMAKSLAQKAKSPEPTWARLIEAVCHYDSLSLTEPATKPGELQQLAALLLFLTVEPGTDGDHRRMSSGHLALTNAPGCYRIADSLSMNGALGIKHQTTVMGAMSFPAMLRGALGAVQDLPAPVRSALNKLPSDRKLQRIELMQGPDILAAFDGLPELVAACVEASESDAMDPSFAAIARITEDAAFLQAANRQVFLARSFGIPVKEYCQHAHKVFAQHPYSCFLKLGTIDAKREPAKYWDILKDLEIVDADPSHHRLIERTWGSPHENRVQGERALKLTLLHTDHDAYDLCFAIQHAKKEEPEDGARRGAHSL